MYTSNVCSLRIYLSLLRDTVLSVILAERRKILQCLQALTTTAPMLQNADPKLLDSVQKQDLNPLEKSKMDVLEKVQVLFDANIDKKHDVFC